MSTPDNPARRGAPIGSDNARGRRDPATPPPNKPPEWYSIARRNFARSAPAFSRENYAAHRGSFRIPWAGVSVRVAKDWRKSDPRRPVIVSARGREYACKDDSEARQIVSRYTSALADVQRASRLLQHPLSDPRLVSALYASMTGNAPKAAATAASATTSPASPIVFDRDREEADFADESDDSPVPLTCRPAFAPTQLTEPLPDPLAAALVEAVAELRATRVNPNLRDDEREDAANAACRTIGDLLDATDNDPERTNDHD